MGPIFHITGDVRSTIFKIELRKIEVINLIID